jgi:predicted nucleotidyltransferase
MEKQRLPLPEAYEKNIRLAVDILKDAGCADIFLFGSLAENNFREGSDIDIAVRGCPKGKFFHALGRLLLELDYPADLTDLDENDENDAFSKYLAQEGGLLKLDNKSFHTDNLRFKRILHLPA